MLAVSRQAPTRCRDTKCGDSKGTDDVAKALRHVGTLAEQSPICTHKANGVYRIQGTQGRKS